MLWIWKSKVNLFKDGLPACPRSVANGGIVDISIPQIYSRHFPTQKAFWNSLLLL